MALDCLINGMTQGFLAPRGYFLTEDAEKKTAEMAALGINWVALVVNQFQETFASTRYSTTIGERWRPRTIAKLNVYGRASKSGSNHHARTLGMHLARSHCYARGNIIAETTI